MTAAQHVALEVLAAAGGEVDSSKRRSGLAGRPNVNYLAARALVRAGLARAHWPAHRSPVDVYVSTTRYSITPAGRLALAVLNAFAGERVTVDVEQAHKRDAVRVKVRGAGRELERDVDSVLIAGEVQVGAFAVPFARNLRGTWDA